MQRKRNTKSKCRYTTFATIHKFTTNLHSIPKLLLITKLKNNSLNTNNSNNNNGNSCNNSISIKNVESNVSYSIPSVVVLVFLFGLFSIVNMYWYGGNNGLAYAAEEDVSITQPETLGDSTASITLDTSKVEVDVAPGSTGYASKNIVLNTNNVESYTLSITGPEILSLENNTSDLNSTNTTTAWGYTYLQNSTITNDEELASLDYNSFTGVNQKLESGTSADSNTRTLAFRASFSDDAIAGHYKAEITLSLAATPKLITYTLTLNNNASSGITNTGTTSKTCETYGDSCSISLSDVVIPSRTGYTFLGWNDSNSATTAQYTADGAGGTADTITLSAANTTNQVKSVYAVWQAQGAAWTLPNGTKIYTGIEYMQEVGNSMVSGGFCGNSIPAGSTITLADKRDYPIIDNVLVPNTYTVRKMSDGKCWMTQNLRITGVSSGTILTPSDSNVSNNFTLPSSNISGFSDRTAANAYYFGMTGYYTWCAATAGTCSLIATTYDHASSSICPRGWRLPGGESDVKYGNEFQKLTTAEDIATNSAAGSAKMQGSPYFFTGTGFAGDEKIQYASEGFWWSGTASSNSGSAYALNIDSGRIFAGTRSRGSHYGNAIRCIVE